MEHTSDNFLQLPEPMQISYLEVLLFASEDSLSALDLFKILIEEPLLQLHKGRFVGTNIPQEVVEQLNVARGQFMEILPSLIKNLNDSLERTNRVYRIKTISGGYQFATLPEFGEILARFIRSKSRKRLSQAALESLAIIAYKQPISKPEVESIRGVSSNEVMNKLLEKNLITIIGRASTPGKPLLYGTTDDFLRAFGLHSLTDLPKPREIEELLKKHVEEQDDDDIITINVESSVEELESKLAGYAQADEEESGAGSEVQ